MSLRFYVVRNNKTGKFLPQSRRAPTHTEPGRKPRLFDTKSGATQAMNWWLNGRAYPVYEFDELMSINSVKHYARKPEDWEVLEVSLEIQ